MQLCLPLGFKMVAEKVADFAFSSRLLMFTKRSQDVWQTVFLKKIFFWVASLATSTGSGLKKTLSGTWLFNFTLDGLAGAPDNPSICREEKRTHVLLKVFLAQFHESTYMRGKEGLRRAGPNKSIVILCPEAVPQSAPLALCSWGASAQPCRCSRFESWQGPALQKRHQ